MASSPLVQKIRELRQAMLDLSNVSGKWRDTGLIDYLDKLSKGGSRISSLAELSTMIDRLAISLKYLGGDAQYIQRVTVELERLALANKQFKTPQTAGLPQGSIYGASYVRQSQADIMLQNKVLTEQEQFMTRYSANIQKWKQISGVNVADPRYRAFAGQSQPLLQQSEQARLEARQQAEIPAEKVPVNTKDIQEGLKITETGAANLTRRLEDMGLTSVKVEKNFRELSNGITTVRLSAQDAEGATVKYTAHIDQAGNILEDTQKRFRTFGDAIRRDIVEVLKWTIAVSAIYAPLRKMQELMVQATEQQSAMADIAIKLGDNQQYLADVFQSSVEVANQTSSSLDGVIKSYGQAIATTGSMTNEAKRLATSEILLRDSMTLAKLGGIDQSQALDTLIGALKQTGLELTQGRQIIDGWVAVSKQANVSLDAMASTFSIVGSAAKDVGITIDQLNAMVAVLAQATELSADETGNAIRGFISGFQSSKAEEVLAKYGIAVRNTAGEVKSFNDIMRELAVLMQEGLLSDKAVSEITNTVGGGWRRGAQFAALLNNYNDVLKLTEVSQNANGDAADALALKMNTLESATTRLNNSFGELAQTLGMEGGVLGFATKATDVFSGLVKVVTDLVHIMGAAAPLLATIGLGKMALGTGTGMRALSGNIPMWLASLIGPTFEQQQRANIGARSPQAYMGFSPYMGGAGRNLLGLGNKVPAFTGGMTTQGIPETVTYQQMFQSIGKSLNDTIQNAFSKVTGGAVTGAGLGTVIGPVAMGISQAARGQWGELGANMAGSFTAAVATNGNPIFTMLGGVLATAFYTNFLTVQPKLAQRWAELQAEAEANARKGKGTPSAEDTQKTMDDIEAQIVKQMSLNEKFWVNFEKFAFQGGNLFAPNKIPNMTQQDIQTMLYQYNKGQMQNPFGTSGFGKFYEKLYFGGKTLSPQTMQLMDELMEKFIQEDFKRKIDLTEAEGGTIKATQEVMNSATDKASELVTKAIDDISRGTSGAVTNFQTASQMSQGLALSAAKLMQSSAQAGLQVPTANQAVSIVSGASVEEMVELTKATDEILYVRKQLDDYSKKPILTTEEAEKVKQLRDRLEEAKEQLATLLPAIQKATLIREAQVKIKPIIDFPEKVTPELAKKIIDQAQQFWTEALKLMGLSDEQIKEWQAIQQQQLVRLTSGIVPGLTTNVPNEFLKQAQEAQGVGGKQNQWSFTDLRDKFSMGNIGSLLTRYAQVMSAFKANVPGFEPDLTSNTLVLKDGFKTLDLDMRLFNLAMQELIDIEKDKTMQGMFNLPSGAQFYVPFNAAAMDANSRASGGGAGLDMSSFFSKYKPDPDAFTREAIEVSKEYMTQFADKMTQAATTTQVKDAYKLPDIMKPENVAEQLNKMRQAEANAPKIVPTPKPEEVTAVPGKGLAPPIGLEQTIIDWIMSKWGGQLAGTAIKGKVGIDQLNIQPPDILSTIRGFFDDLEKRFVNPSPGTAGGANVGGIVTQGILGPALEGLTKEASKAPSLKLTLDINSNTNLLIDGRVLATVIKPYLYEDLLRFEGTNGSINKVIQI